MFLLTLLLINVLLISPSVLEEVQLEKQKLLNKELEYMIGHDIVLSESESKANQIIMDLKLKEIENGFLNPQNYTFADNFFTYKDKVKRNKLFQILKPMPKGALLHAHDTGLLSAEYMLSFTYWDNLYVCFHNGEVDFRFSSTDPSESGKYPCGTRWQLMRDVRNSSADIERFDADLKAHFTMVVDNPYEVYSDNNAAWAAFQKIFITTANLVQYKPAWEQYFYDTLKALREDGIMYFEIRSVLPSLYDLDENTYDAVATAETYKRVADRFKADYPDFFGVKLIYAPLRKVSLQAVKDYLATAREINRRLPGFLAGFDLVGQEDSGEPLEVFLPELVDAKKDFDLFLHAGETNWNGLSSDENLFDAIALGAKRLGHAYSLVKHPVLTEEVKKRNIGLEVNVVSNAVLKLITDVRNHPLSSWLAQNMPVIVCSDDPGLWGADPLTHDFYVVFVGVSSRHADLRMLKKLALNSLYHSTYSNKEMLKYEFEIRWTKFIASVVNSTR